MATTYAFTDSDVGSVVALAVAMVSSSMMPSIWNPATFKLLDAISDSAETDAAPVIDPPVPEPINISSSTLMFVADTFPDVEILSVNTNALEML